MTVDSAAVVLYVLLNNVKQLAIPTIEDFSWSIRICLFRRSLDTFFY